MDFDSVWGKTLGIVSGVTKAEARALYDLSSTVHQASSGTIVEIGSYTGKSTALLAATGTIWSIDHHRGNSEHQPGQERCRPGTVVEEHVDTFPVFKKNMQTLGLWERVRVLVMDHLSALAVMPTESFPIRMLFIDAEHTYEANLSIINTWLPRTRGVIAFHDYCKEFPGMIASIDQSRNGLGAEVAKVGSLIVFDTRIPHDQ